MILARVVGSVWGGKEAKSLNGAKLLQVLPVRFPDGMPAQTIRADGEQPGLGKGLKVVVDQLGAGIGEYVLVAHGSRVRDLTVGSGIPTKEVVIAIVDSCDVDLRHLED